MKREEAVKILGRLLLHCNPTDCLHSDCTKCVEAINMAEDALEQEPRIGHWIYDYEYSNWFDVTYECSCCKRTIIVPYEAKNEVYKDYPYCHCGAKMAESEE